MDGVGTSIVGRPRRLSADRRARPTYTLIWEEPFCAGLNDSSPCLGVANSVHKSFNGGSSFECFGSLAEKGLSDANYLIALLADLLHLAMPPLAGTSPTARVFEVQLMADLVSCFEEALEVLEMLIREVIRSQAERFAHRLEILPGLEARPCQELDVELDQPGLWLRISDGPLCCFRKFSLEAFLVKMSSEPPVRSTTSSD